MPDTSMSVLLNKHIAEWLATFERKVRLFGEMKVKENWRKWYDKELMQLFGDSDRHSFVRISQLNWIGHINRMESKSKVKCREVKLKKSKASI